MSRMRIRLTFLKHVFLSDCLLWGGEGERSEYQRSAEGDSEESQGQAYLEELGAEQRPGHPGSGADSTQPSGIDYRHHRRLEKGGFQALGIIMTRDGYVRFYTDEMISYKVNNPKRKIIEINSGRSLGTIKFKCEKGKNLSTPQNNKFWKESNKKKMTNYVLLSL